MQDRLRFAFPKDIQLFPKLNKAIIALEKRLIPLAIGAEFGYNYNAWKPLSNKEELWNLAESKKRH